MQPLFHDPALQRAFEENGFAVLPFFKAEALNRLRVFFEAQAIRESRAFYTSTDLDRRDFRLAGDALIREELAQAGMDRLVSGYEPFFASYIVKQPVSAGDSTVDLHADWSIQDETRHQALTLWFPLQDVDADNGCMHVIPGSHRKVQRIRGVGIPEPYRAYRSLVSFRDLHPLPMKVGEVLCYHNALLHASPPNTTALPRLACLVACHPRGVQPLLYYQRFWRLRSPVQRYALNPEFLATYDKRSRPERLKFLGAESYRPPRISRRDFLNFLNATPAHPHAYRFT
jgi:hypothetical protein